MKSIPFLKKILIVLLVCSLSTYSQSIILHGGYSDDDVFLLKKTTCDYDTTFSVSKPTEETWKFGLKSTTPQLYFISIKNDNKIIGPYWISNTGSDLEIFKSVNNSPNYDNYAYNKYFLFFEGSNSSVNKILYKYNQMLLTNYPFTSKSVQNPDIDSLTLTRAQVYFKMDSLSQKVKAMISELNASKEKPVIDFIQNSWNNYVNSTKLNYIAYEKYYNRSFDWKKTASPWIESFAKTSDLYTDKNYFFAYDNIAFLYDSTGYYEPLPDTSNTPILDSVAATPVYESYILEDYQKNITKLNKIKLNSTVNKTIRFRFLSDLVNAFKNEYYNYDTLYKSYLNEIELFQNTYPNYGCVKELKTTLDRAYEKQKVNYPESSYSDIVDTTAYLTPDSISSFYTPEVTKKTLPTGVLKYKNGITCNLKALATSKKIVVIPLKYAPSEKDQIYYKYIEKQHKKIKFIYLITDSYIKEDIENAKFKGDLVLTTEESSEDWYDFMYTNYEYFVKINPDGSYNVAYNLPDLEKLIK
ncbi:MAG: hypothetical protein U0V72_14985 [Cytophagales bacterium]